MRSIRRSRVPTISTGAATVTGAAIWSWSWQGLLADRDALQIFMLLYRHRGDVVYNDRIHAELGGTTDLGEKYDR
jgi:hypothetical protein